MAKIGTMIRPPNSTPTRTPLRLRGHRRECECAFQPGDAYCAECDDRGTVDCDAEANLCDCCAVCWECGSFNVELRGANVWCLACDCDAHGGLPLESPELEVARG